MSGSAAVRSPLFDDAPAGAIVIPAYNEAARLEPTLLEVRRFAETWQQPLELIVVDDGSRDATVACARRVMEQPAGLHRARAPWSWGPLRVRLLENRRNRGKGFAVRRGMRAARAARWRLMCDADLPTPLSELPRLLAALEAGADVVIGSRDIPPARLDPPQPLLRRAAALLFRALRRQFLAPVLRDTQCGFKLFCTPAAEVLFARLREPGWLFDCELLAHAERLGMRIVEVGVLWRDDARSHVPLVSTALGTLPALWRIRARVRRFSAEDRRIRDA